MTLAEFNKKWDSATYNAMMNSEENWDKKYSKYVEDCYTMYEHYGFTDTFETTYSEKTANNGLKFKVLRRATTKDGFDLEVLPAWEIECENGDKFMAFPEEICKIERTS